MSLSLTWSSLDLSSTLYNIEHFTCYYLSRITIVGVISYRAQTSIDTQLLEIIYKHRKTA